MHHAVDATSMSKIKSLNWDFIVLQAQSQEPSWPVSQLDSEVFPYAVQINDSIKANNSCTELVFYMTWGRKFGDASNCAGWPPVCTYKGMQDRLMVGYLTMAEMTQATVSPVGMAWMKSRLNNSALELYSADYSHPTVAGTYLTACVMYATMFRKSPVGATYISTISQSDAEFLQHIADTVVMHDSYAYYLDDSITTNIYDLNRFSWFENGNIVFADFGYFDNSGVVDFIDNSLNADSYIWNFGDCYSSVDQNPQHTYISNGSYIVTLQASNACFADSISDTLNITTTSLTDNNSMEYISVYPNPASEDFFIELAENSSVNEMSYQIFEISGRKVIEERLKAGKNQISTGNLNGGIYLMEVVNGNEIMKCKIVITR